MDVNDVSDNIEFIAALRKAQNLARLADQRKGQLVQDHPNPEFLIAKHIKDLMGSDIRAVTGITSNVTTSQLLHPYPPCIKPLSELKPINISKLNLETHHRGYWTLLRILTQPRRCMAVMAVVEDVENTAVLLQLHNQPDENLVPAKNVLRWKSFCIVKEPLFKCAMDGAYLLRVDHPSDVIWLDDSDERLPLRWRKAVLTLDGGSQELRAKGNEAVQRKRWAEAERLYSSAIKTAKKPEEERLAYLNRSFVNLNLKRPSKALADATRGSNISTPSEMRLFRESRALYEQGNFQQCLETLQTLTESYTENKYAKYHITRVKERLNEEQGQYTFSDMYKQAEKTPPLIDCATFAKLVEVRASPGKGKGLFTTRDVASGDLLLCEKAFAYVYAGKDHHSSARTMLMNVQTGRMVFGGQASLITQIVQKLYHSPELSRPFLDLHCGDYPKIPVLDCDGHPVVDSFLVDKIVSLNSIGAPRTTREIYDKMDIYDRENPNYHTCGIWLLASRINHSCMSNCRRAFIGDMQIIRATKDLPAGTELVFSYEIPNAVDDYDEAQDRLKHWGFWCDCEICMDKIMTPRETLLRRKAICGLLRSVLKGPEGTDVFQTILRLNQLEETYEDPKTTSIRLPLWDPYFSLGAALTQDKKPADGVKMFVKGLEALGYTVTAVLPVGKNKDKKAEFEIKQWGLATEYTSWVFGMIFDAYKELAPEILDCVAGYVEAAYSMVVGERETAWKEFKG